MRCRPYDDWHKLAWAGALLVTATVLTLSIIARICSKQNGTDPWIPQWRRRNRDKPKIDIRDLSFFYGSTKSLKNITLPLLRPQGHGLHRPLGLRQVHLAARHQPHL